MSPVERAKALGWERREGWWIAVDMHNPGGGDLLKVGIRRGNWYVPLGQLTSPDRAYFPVEFPREDEALEHALLLLDVWLS